MQITPIIIACILNASFSCHAMLRTVGQLPRITHVAAQTATLKRSMHSKSIAESTTEPIHEECRNKYYKLKERVEKKQLRIEQLKENLQEAQAEYGTLEDQLALADKELHLTLSMKFFASRLKRHEAETLGQHEALTREYAELVQEIQRNNKRS